MADRRARALGVVTGAALLLGAVVAFTARPAPALRAVERVRLERAGVRFLEDDGIVLQTGWRDCGPAALARLLALHGLPHPGPDSLAVLAGMGPVGTSLGGLARAARAAGLEAAPRRLPPDRPPPAPLLAWVDRSHFVVIERIEAGRATIADPAVGRYTTPLAELRRRWTGEALVVTSPGAAALDPPYAEVAVTP